MDGIGDQRPQGLYSPSDEHDACGVGFVAHIKGARSHAIVRSALDLLINLEHRGACGSDPDTGDGAGILIQMPDRFFRKVLSFALPAAAQTPWPDGKSAAIVLTYDDALASQLDVAVPQLDAARLKGTFFLSGRLTATAMNRWRRAQRRGHELGNHSVNHPCGGS